MCVHSAIEEEEQLRRGLSYGDPTKRERSELRAFQEWKTRAGVFRHEQVRLSVCARWRTASIGNLS